MEPVVVFPCSRNCFLIAILWTPGPKPLPIPYGKHGTSYLSVQIGYCLDT